MEHTSPRHVHYFKSRTVILIVCIAEFIFALPLLYSRSTMYLGFVLLFNSALMYTFSILRIVVSPSGISYHNMGLYSLHSTWDNIDRVGLVDFRAFGSQRCIILKEGKQLGWWTSLAWAVPKEKRGSLIPIPDGKNWDKYGELFKEIKKYKPEISGLD